jgi:hypothetical protein
MEVPGNGVNFLRGARFLPGAPGEASSRPDSTPTRRHLHPETPKRQGSPLAHFKLTPWGSRV